MDQTNGTAALDQVGTVGAANSASSFFATRSNATCLQAVSDATSRNRNLPVFIKRLVGMGIVSLTLDGGTTWIDITMRLIAKQWVDCITAQAAVTNPTWGIRLSTSGDEIAWELGRCVDGYHPDPPPLLTAFAETNSADTLAIPRRPLRI